MSVLIFIIVIVLLIVVHELGHFVVAKLSRMRVDEFGLGYPPRALTIAKIGETEYTLNWLPFGGFVKIFGEDGTPTEEGVKKDSRAFSSRPRILQALVLLAGIAMNLIFAYVLITAALVFGTPQALSKDQLATAGHQQLVVADVLPKSPAALAGLTAGDSLTSAEDAKGKWQASDPDSFTTFINESDGSPITLHINRNGSSETLSVTPATGVVASDPSRYALGVEIATVGVESESFSSAITDGFTLTWATIVLTAQGLAHFFYGIVTFSADLSQVSGPVGIASVVGSASAEGFGNLLSIMAVISINLALINLIPIPALDGGRLLFVIIESITRRPIKARIANTLNAAGFAFLLLLMVVVTAHDIFKLVG